MPGMLVPRGAAPSGGGLEVAPPAQLAGGLRGHAGGDVKAL